MSETHAIDAEAVRWREAAGGREGSELLVVMHGLGSNEHDLLGLAPLLGDRATIASLRAPLPYGGGWAWFGAGGQASTDQSLIDASARGVLDWLDTLGDTFSRVGLLGFSQGGAMSLQLLRLAPERFAYAVQLSGFVAAGGHEGDAVLAAAEPRIPAFQAIGTMDPVIEPAATARTTEWMARHLDVESHAYPMAHQVTQPEIDDVVAFLARVSPAARQR